MNIQPINIKQKARLTENGELIVEQPAVIKKAEATQMLATEESLAELVAANNTEAAVEVLDETLASVTEEVSSEESLSEEGQQTVPNVDILKIYAEQGSWMEVRDASETRLFYNMIAKGGAKTLQGQAPFRISMGNAKTTELVINDIVIDVSKYIRKNNTAKFTVSTEDQRVLFH